MQQIKTFLGIGESAPDAVCQAEDFTNVWLDANEGTIERISKMHTTATVCVVDDGVNITEAHTFTITILYRKH